MTHPRTATLLLTALCATTAHADGQYPMFNDIGESVGDFLILGDVYTPDGRTLVWVEMPAMDMWLYFPPEAIYVTIDANNPIIRNQIPFYGEWMGTHPNAQPCGNGVAIDHEGYGRPEWGEVILTNTGVSDSEILFEMDLSSCGGPMSFFAYYDPFAGGQGIGGGPVKGGQTNIITK